MYNDLWAEVQGLVQQWRSLVTTTLRHHKSRSAGGLCWTAASSACTPFVLLNFKRDMLHCLLFCQNSLMCLSQHPRQHCSLSKEVSWRLIQWRPAAGQMLRCNATCVQQWLRMGAAGHCQLSETAHQAPQRRSTSQAGSASHQWLD